MNNITNTIVREILEAAANLPIEEQETLVETLQNRLRNAKRKQLIAEVQEAQKEFTQGKCQGMTPQQIIAELLA
jgi:adenine-specific DNA methylase